MKNLEIKGAKNTFLVYQFHMHVFDFYYLRPDESYLEIWFDYYNKPIKQDVVYLCRFFRKEYKNNTTYKQTRTEP